MQRSTSSAPRLEEEGKAGISLDGRQRVAAALNRLLADFFALYIKTKSCHWHMNGSHFRDYHLLLDEQAAQIFEATDDLAERVRKLDQPTVRSIGEIVGLRRISDGPDQADAPAMLQALLANNREVATWLRESHHLCETHGDIATASLLENWLDQAEGRIWFLSETAQTQ